MSADRRSANWIRYSGIGFELAGAIAGFALLGYWIDGRYGTSPWGILAGVCIGIIGGLYNLVRQSLDAIREAKSEDADAEEKG
jgi:ATP synthase protein I